MHRRDPSIYWRRSPLAALALPVLALVVVVVIGVTAQSSHANSGGSSPTPPPVTGTAPLGNTSLTPAYHGPWGIPAIHPEAALANSTGPHFTLADVEQYLAANPMPDAVKGAPAPTVVSFTCGTPKQLAAQWPSITGTGVALVCMVIVSGSFIGSGNGPDLPGYPSATPAPSTTGDIAFDAYTGNIIMSDLLW